MGIEREDSVEKVLKALGRVEVPEGLEARVAQGLAGRALAAEAREFRWRDVVAGSAVGGVWWRGAACGIAASMLVVGVMMVAGHFMRGGGPKTAEVAVRREVGVPAGSVKAVADDGRGVPCVGAGVVRVQRVAASQESGRMLVASTPRWQRVPGPGLTGSGLTKEERELVQVVQKVDVRELASLNPEIRERLDAEEAAQFQKFFAEPVRPVEPVAAEPVAPVAAEPAKSIWTAEPGGTQEVRPAEDGSNSDAK